jgi:co-chaperonin GroES (HSP10)
MSEKFTKLRPAPGKFVAIYENRETKRGALYLPNEIIRNEATVLAVGDAYFDADGQRIAFPYAEGDVVVSNRLWGTPWQEPGKEGPGDPVYYVHSFKDAIAAVEGE